MSRIIDLTFAPGLPPDYGCKVYRRTIPLASPGVKYTGVVYNFEINSMSGSYLDLPGHIAETDNGVDMANYPLEKLFRRRAVVIHLNRESGSGGISGTELEAACQCPIQPGDALIINALGAKSFYEIDERSVYFDKSAVEFMLEKKIELLVSDVFECKTIEGVFLRFFEKGISTVCSPVNMDQLTSPEVKLTVMMLPISGVTQFPCRIIAELPDDHSNFNDRHK